MQPSDVPLEATSNEKFHCSTLYNRDELNVYTHWTLVCSRTAFNFTTLSRKKIHPWSWNGAKYKITAVVAETFFFLYIFSDLYFSLQVTINALDTFFHSGPRVSVLLPWTLHFWGLPVCTARLTPLVIYVGYVRKKGSWKSRSCSVNTKQSISLSRSQRKSNINSIYETSQNPSCVFLRLIDVSVTGNQSRL